MAALLRTQFGQPLPRLPNAQTRNKNDAMTLSISGAPRQAAVPVLIALSVTHLLNDTIQSLIPAIYPIIKESYQLDFIQIGLITMTFQVSASLLQPLVGLVTDRHPMPYSMVDRM